jgi:hypothetical protein
MRRAIAVTVAVHARLNGSTRVHAARLSFTYRLARKPQCDPVADS